MAVRVAAGSGRRPGMASRRSGLAPAAPGTRGSPARRRRRTADGYRNNTFRTVEHVTAPWRLLAGPWSHRDPGALPTRAEHRRRRRDHRLLRRAPARRNAIGARPAQVFVRRPTPPKPDLELHDGVWRDIPGWPPPGSAGWCCHPLVTASTPSKSRATSVWRRGSRAPERCHGASHRHERVDDARSLRYDWPIGDGGVAPGEVLGNPRVTLRVRSSAPVAFVSVKLCDVFPDGTSALTTRGCST